MKWDTDNTAADDDDEKVRWKSEAVGGSSKAAWTASCERKIEYQGARRRKESRAKTSFFFRRKWCLFFL